VVLPTHDRREHLEGSIGSVLAQTFPWFELIIVDDGSGDDTESYVRGLKDPRIVYAKQPVNRGQAAARNLGIRQARAPRVAFQDSDDEWVQDKLALQVEAMDRNPEAVMIYGDLLRVPITGEPFALRAPELQPGKLFDERPTAYATLDLGIQTCLIRRELLLKMGGFDERLRCLEDMELFLRITRRYPTVRLPRVLCRYHETEGVSKANGARLAARSLLLRRYAVPLLLRKPKWFFREISNVRHHRPLGA